MLTLCQLAKAGYGSIAEWLAMDGERVLDLIEYEQMSSAIEEHLLNEAKRGR